MIFYSITNHDFLSFNNGFLQGLAQLPYNFYGHNYRLKIITLLQNKANVLPIVRIGRECPVIKRETEVI